ncbi:MAG TPA: hypothetical protein VGJ05_20900 [Fimbriiglobus sp.]|jgi:hypothetical protein
MSALENPSVELVAERSGKRWKITVKVNGATGFIDVINPAIATARAKYVKTVTALFPAVPADAIEAELLKVGIETEVPRQPAAGFAPGDPLAETPADILADANRILADPELIRRICDDVATLGVAGERELGLTVFLIGVSRLLNKPLAGIVRGSSTSGKSFIIERVASLFPPDAVIYATQMTPQALFHMPPNSLRHKWVVAGERSRLEDDDRAEATRALREMLSAGKLSKLMPVKVEGGRIETQTIEQEGPIAFIESTTLTTIFEEDANRCLLLGTDEREDQTRRIVTQLAGSHSAHHNDCADRVRAIHYAIQRMLPAVDVRVPFAERIGERIDCSRVEVRRAFPQLISLIQACALLHFQQRETASDGKLLATATDYQIARRLITKPFSLSLGGGVSDSALRFFEKLKGSVLGEFTTPEAKKVAVAGKSSVHGWLSELHDAGAVEIVDLGKGRKPTRWRLTGNEPLPGAGIIPEVEDIFPEYRNRGHNAYSPDEQGE